MIKMYKGLDSSIWDYDLKNPINWFDIELKQTLGIDVYNYVFPKDKGYQIIKKSSIELLILKLEIDDSIIEEALIDFLGLDSDFKLESSNVADSKQYADLYKQFKNEVNFSDSYLHEMIESKYTKHFFSEEEVDNMYERWS